MSGIQGYSTYTTRPLIYVFVWRLPLLFFRYIKAMCYHSKLAYRCRTLRIFSSISNLHFLLFIFCLFFKSFFFANENSYLLISFPNSLTGRHCSLHSLKPHRPQRNWQLTFSKTLFRATLRPRLFSYRTKIINATIHCTQKLASKHVVVVMAGANCPPDSGVDSSSE